MTATLDHGEHSRSVTTTPLRRTSRMSALVRHRSRPVAVGPFTVADRGYEELLTDLVATAVRTAGTKTFVSYALHVGGLNSRRDNDYLGAMAAADNVYADGVSVVMLARIAGAGHIERAGTTDLGWDVLHELRAWLGRPVRVALLGGVDGVARRAGEVLERDAGVEVVFADHGYHQSWEAVLDRVGSSGCDVLFVGLGAPLEMTWVQEHRDQLPKCLTMTCGGWFGFLTMAEKRAPLWMQKSGLEWTYRLAQAPGRLARRYLSGAVMTARFAAVLAVRRIAG